MKNILYIFIIILLSFSACTDDSLIQQKNDEIKEGYVSLQFEINDMPEFSVSTKAAGEYTVGNLSLMTFDDEGKFLGRVPVSDFTEGNTTGTGSGKVLVNKNTKRIHFVANYPWKVGEYIESKAEDEYTLMPSLETEITGTKAFDYVAWGYVGDVDLQSSTAISVGLCRNYAKVTIRVDLENNSDPFEVAGFALGNYVYKGTVVTWGEDSEGSFENVTQNDQSVTKITPVDEYLKFRRNQNSLDCDNLNDKYMFENPNDYENQTFVIIKKAGSPARYYKIQLLDKAGTPFTIERNYQYDVIIKKFTEEAKGSSSYEEALKAAPTNNIFAEISKDAPTISDAKGNKMTVTPLYHLFTKNGTLEFTANYKENNILKNSSIALSLVTNGNGNSKILNNISIVDATTGTVTADVNLPQVPLGGTFELDSATVLVKSGFLTRIVTVYVSKIYSFQPVTGSTYEKIGDQVILKFTIPNNFPPKLLSSLKCYIKAEDLNPDNSVNTQKHMLMVYKDNTYYYVYEPVSTGEQIVYFKTTRPNVKNPTVSNEYFTTATIPLKKGDAHTFQDVSVKNAPYEKNGKFDLTFTIDKAATVLIEGDGVNEFEKSFSSAGTYTIQLTTDKFGASGNIILSADNFDDGKISYVNSGKFENSYTLRSGSLYYKKISDGKTTSINNSNIRIWFVTPDSNNGITYCSTHSESSVSNLTTCNLQIPSGTASTDGVIWGYKSGGINYYTYQSLEEIMSGEKAVLRIISGSIKEGNNKDVAKNTSVTYGGGGAVTVTSKGKYVFYPDWSNALDKKYKFGWKNNGANQETYTNEVSVGAIIRYQTDNDAKTYPIEK